MPRTPLAPLAPNAWLRWDVVRRLLPRERVHVLEIGCGRGGFGTRLAARYRYVAVEPDPESWAVAVERVQAVDAEAEILHRPLEDLDPGRVFDVVCAFEVLEHLEDDAAALERWVSHVRTGGLLLLSTPAWSASYGPWDEMAGHYRRYDPSALRGLLERSGLVDVHVTVYGGVLGHVLEAVRHRMVRRATGAADGSRGRRTSESGRVLQPSARWVGAATAAGTLPFRLLQRAFPGHGTGLVGWGRRAGEGGL